MDEGLKWIKNGRIARQLNSSMNTQLQKQFTKLYSSKTNSHAISTHDAKQACDFL